MFFINLLSRLNLLSFILFILFFSILHLSFISSKKEYLIKSLSLSYSVLIFFLSIFLWIFFDKNSINFQFIQEISWLSFYENFTFVLGIDGISLFFILLTTLLIPLCILSAWSSITFNIKDFLISFLILEFLLILVFSVLDLFLFYIFFESVLIPMFLVIGFWGSRQRKIRASYMFFLYTLFGSILMLLAIISIYLKVGSTNFLFLTNLL